MAELTIYYDSHCPLCVGEMRKLLQLDAHRRLRLVDLHQPHFSRDYPHIDRAAALGALHGELADGTVLMGLDTSHKAWSLVGRGWLTAPLRWRLVRPVADACYRMFARHRYHFSLWFTGRARCKNGGGCNLFKATGHVKAND